MQPTTLTSILPLGAFRTYNDDAHINMMNDTNMTIAGTPKASG